MHCRYPIRLLCLATLPLAAACTTIPTTLQGDFALVTPAVVAERGTTGQQVRWGGVIIEAEPGSAQTCVQILSLPLSDSTARPRLPARSVQTDEGRFLACRSGFVEPELFAPGREVTVSGQVVALEERAVGEYLYRMPQVAADTIHLWAERRPQHQAHYNLGYWHGPWPYWYGGFYHRSPVHYHHHTPIIRPPPQRLTPQRPPPSRRGGSD
ncbi:MAG: Slp family lipoprotein [Xanthomonadales bacterium]|nr:Slp family lipoprotein [Xanthomonadales bacterium]